jgi:predicted CXXCH cytochrome family protein
MSNVIRLALVAALAAPAAALATGAHDGVGCTGCHAIHTAKGDVIFAVAPNKSDLNPRTKTPYSGKTALCLGCHQDSGKGGQGYAPIHSNLSHPYGLTNVDLHVAKVPGDLLRDGKFECVSCHDPHPSNPNYKYLRVDTGAKGQNMDPFCAVCHPIKADAALAANRASLFSSMDETGTRVLRAAPAAGAAPAKPAAKPAAPAPAKKP